MKKQPCNSRQIAYPWVLRREKAENSHTLEQHLDRLEEAGVAPEDIVYDIESDVDVDRPAFKKAMELIQSSWVSETALSRWDRFIRGGGLYQKFKEAVPCEEVQIHSLDQGHVDLDTASNRLRADLQALFSDHERDMLCERTSKGDSYRRQRQAACPYPWAEKFSTSYTKEQIDRLLAPEQEQTEEERNEKTTS